MGLFANKALIITGGTGSFGNTVLNRFLKADIGAIRVSSRDEKKQNDMQHEFQAKMPDVADKIKFYIGDVRDLNRSRVRCVEWTNSMQQRSSRCHPASSFRWKPFAPMLSERITCSLWLLKRRGGEIRHLSIDSGTQNPFTFLSQIMSASDFGVKKNVSHLSEMGLFIF